MEKGKRNMWISQRLVNRNLNDIKTKEGTGNSVMVLMLEGLHGEKTVRGLV